MRLLLPDLPSPEGLMPYLRRIEAAGRYTNGGDLSQAFEAAVLDHLEVGGGVGWESAATSSATLGLELAIEALLDRREGGRVLVPALSFAATATTVLRVGATPVLADVGPGGFHLTPSAARRIVDRMRIDLIVPVAAYGLPVDAAAWDRFAIDTGIPVLIDAAAAFGSQRPGATATTIYSFHATKAFGIGEGGMVVSTDPAVTRAVRRRRNFGFEDGIVTDPGTNAKLSEFHAAVGLAQLARTAEIGAWRRALAASYEVALRARLPDARPVVPDTGIPWIMLADLAGPDDAVVDLGTVRAALARRGIESRQWYAPPLHRHPAFAALERVDADGPSALRETDRLTARLLGLPFHHGISQHDVATVVDALATALTPSRVTADAVAGS